MIGKTLLESLVPHRWRQRLGQWITYRRNQQESIDYYRAASLGIFYDRNIDSFLAESSEKRHTLKFNEAIDHEGEPLMRLGYWKHHALCRDMFRRQVGGLLAHADRIGGQDPYPLDILPPTGVDRVTSATDAMLRHQGAEVRSLEEAVGQDIHHPAGFRLRIQRSRIDHPAAGFGVFVSGRVLPGTVLAMYPGVVYFSRNIPAHVLKDDNEYLISRYDGALIDGREWTHKATRLRSLGHVLRYAGAAHDSRHMAFRNPFAISNYINHPPPGVKNNCVSLEFNVRVGDFPPSLMRFLPNPYYENATLDQWMYATHAIVARCVLTIAARHLCDEELLLNYRLNPANSAAYPDWYRQPDEEEAKRRWGRLNMLL